MTAEDLTIALSCVGLVAVLLVGLHALSKADVPVITGEARCCRILATAQTLGVTLMAALDAALARFTAFVSGVLGQVTAAKDTNDAQTAKLAELQVALDAALSDDVADKAAITALQVEIANLQDTVAAQINAAVDALESAPAPSELVVVEEPVFEEAPVVDEVGPVVEEEVVFVEEVPVVVEEVPVVESPVVDDTVAVVDEAVVSDVE